MTDFFCGIGNVPKGKKRGTAQQCYNAKQVRYYGVEAIDSSLFKPKSRDNLVKEQIKLRKLIDKAKILKNNVKKMDAIIGADKSTAKQKENAKKQRAKLVASAKKLVEDMKKQKAHNDELEKQINRDENNAIQAVRSVSRSRPPVKRAVSRSKSVKKKPAAKKKPASRSKSVKKKPATRGRSASRGRSRVRTRSVSKKAPAKSASRKPVAKKAKKTKKLTAAEKKKIERDIKNLNNDVNNLKSSVKSLSKIPGKPGVKNNLSTIKKRQAEIKKLRQKLRGGCMYGSKNMYQYKGFIPGGMIDEYY